MGRPKTFIITECDEELEANAGFALVGQALRRHAGLASADEQIPLRSHGIPHSDVLASFIGLLTIGKSDFEAITDMAEEPFFREALGIRRVPSEATLRQRFDNLATELLPHAQDAAVNFLASVGVAPAALGTGHVPLDADVTPFDNSDTRKEGVSYTYKGHDGYAPMAAYLGREGYCLEVELREGSQHCQRGTPAFLERVLAKARRVTDAPLLVRLDGGNDAVENIAVIEGHNGGDEARADYLIKWNPRQADPEAWRREAERRRAFEETRPGKRVAVFSETVDRRHRKQTYHLRRVIRVVERTRHRTGQEMLIPEIELEGWWTSLEVPGEDVIALYADHGTSEQFHSELKRDLDIERLPSGKFDTNALVLACATVAFNILRWIGQNGLRGPRSPVRHPAKRRRLRTVIQELMCVAARMIKTGRRLKLAFSRRCVAKPVFEALYRDLASA